MAVVFIWPGNGAPGQFPGGCERRADLKALAVAFCLTNLARHIGVFLFRLDHGEGGQTGEQHIVSAAFLIPIGGGPFCDGPVMASGR